MASQARTNVKISGALTTQTLVSAVAGYRIRVLSYVLVAAGTLTARFCSTSTVQDSYSETNANTTLGTDGTIVRYGQSFTASVSGLLETAQFYISKFGSPTGTVTANLYAHTGTFGTTGTPTGAALATSGTLDISTLTTSNVLTTFTFTTTNRYAIVAGTKYCIELIYTGGDASNYLVVGVDTTAPTHSGNAFSYNGSYTAIAGDDIPFYVNASEYLTGAMTMVVGQPIVNELQREGHFETVAGEALTMTLSTTTQVSGHLTYALVQAT